MAARLGRGSSGEVMVEDTKRLRVRVWDLPTRLFHWLLVLLVAGAVLTGFVAPEWWMGIHLWSGYGIVALIVFRLVWGVFGPEYSRIASFAYGPRQIRDYVNGLLLMRPPHHLGHNPAGAAMIYLLAVVLVGATISGLLVLGGEEKQGPLAGLASYALGAGAKPVHEGLVVVLLVLVAAHVAGVVVHRLVTGERLIAAMITGDKLLPQGTPLPTPRAPRPGAAMASMAVIVGSLAMALAGLSRLPPTGIRQLAENPAYAEECGACHDAFHPSLLPSASWAALLAALEDHFGEDASLDPALTEELAAWLTAHAAETWDTEAANRFRRLDPEQPLRITATPYWGAKHGQIPAGVFKRRPVGSRSHCSACHRDAAIGRFDDQAIAIPSEEPV